MATQTALHPAIGDVTARIARRSAESRRRYLARLQACAENGPRRAHLSCSGLAHAAAAMGPDKERIAFERKPNLAIVSAYNDMLSAHKPYEHYPELIRREARAAGASAQMAGGVPAMCDGITQGQPGMEISLFSRDVIALASAVALSHNVFDAALFLGVCDKIIPGMVMAAAAFGHLPAIFMPAGPMPSGLANDEKAKLRQRYAAGEATREELLRGEMAAYHGPGTCTFYGTSNSNQMLLEIMGLMLPGAAFVPPEGPLREALNRAAVRRALEIAAQGESFLPLGRILDARAFVNGIVGLMATGGSTNLLLHLPAMAQAAGILLEMEDFQKISAAVPLLARIYPNGLADVNQFHAAGGTPWLIRELLDAGLLHPDVLTIMGRGLAAHAREPRLIGGELRFESPPPESGNAAILRPAGAPFQQSGGLALLRGNLGEAVMKVSAIAPERLRIEAPARIFHDQHAVKAAFRAGALDQDGVIVLRFQGPRANGMPELHGLMPLLSVLQDRGHKVALLTDGRLSGASGKVPAAIHLSPEAAAGGPIARLRDGDRVLIDAAAGRIEALAEGLDERPATPMPPPDPQADCAGAGLFGLFRAAVGDAGHGASAILPGAADGGAGVQGAAAPAQDAPARDEKESMK